MTPTMEARLQALTLAVHTPGNPNKLTLAKEYLAFMREDEAPVKTEAVRPVDKARKGN